MSIPSAAEIVKRREEKREANYAREHKAITERLSHHLDCGVLSGVCEFKNASYHTARLTEAFHKILVDLGYVNVQVDWKANSFWYSVHLPNVDPPPKESPPPYQDEVRPPKSKRQWCWPQ